MIRKLGGYFLTGGAAAIVDIAGFGFFTWAGLPIMAAAVISQLITAFVNYNLTSRFVFRRERSPGRGLLFLFAAAIGLCVNAGVTTLAVIWTDIDPVMGKAMGIATAFLLNFVLNALLVFR